MSMSSASDVAISDEPYGSKENLVDETPVLTRRQWVIGALLIISGLAECAVYSCIAPFFPKEAAAKGTSREMIGLIFGIFQVVVIIFSPVWGKLMNTLGAKFILCSGLLATGVSNVLFGLLYMSAPGATFIGLCFAIRVGQAFGDSMFNTAAMAVAAKEFPQHVSTMIGLLTTFMSVGFTAGPALGGLLYDVGGFRLPFFVLGGTVLVCMVACILLIPRDISLEDQTTSGYRDLLRSPVTLMCIAMSIVSTIGPSFVDPTLEFHLRPFHLTHAQVGLFFLLIGGMSIFSSPIFGFLVDKYGHGKIVMAVGAFLAFVANTFFGPAPYLHIPTTLWLTGLSMGLGGFAVGMQFVPVFAELGEVAKSRGYPDNYETNGLISGIFQGSYSLGLFIGPTVGSAMTARIGFGWATTFVALLNLALALVFASYILYKKARKGSAEQGVPEQFPE